jgi:multiple sugar transport system ATP-binding protein
VFLFDEPLSNLDAKLRVQMRLEISRLHTQLGTTMIYVTHDQVEAMTLGNRIVVMKDGIARQIAEPIILYDHPADRFVAGFIGTPPMNFFEGRILQVNGVLTFSSDEGFNLPVPMEQQAALSAYKDRKVVAGIRPEDIGSHAAEMGADYPRIRARVEVIEPMGSESYIHYRVGGVLFVSRVDAHKRLKIGEDQEPGVLLSKMHFFDPQTDVVIRTP